jgi:starch synthase
LHGAGLSDAASPTRRAHASFEVKHSMQVLYVSTEVHPALKTGGLADVNAALPKALIDLGVDVRLLLPAFPAIVEAAEDLVPVAGFRSELGAPRVTIWRARLSGVATYLIEAASLYDRPGNPYVDATGREWSDSHRRFALLGRIASRFADGSIDQWRPDVIHGHDWHAGLMPAYVAALSGERPATVFTVHNLAFQGQFGADVFGGLELPSSFFAMHGLEFYGHVNFMKSGLYFADRVTTVSPTYAREIMTPEQGFGMDGLLRERSATVSGILNGVESSEWNPETDPRIAANFSIADPTDKARCKIALQNDFGLTVDASTPVFGVVSRLSEQKGLDILLAALPSVVGGGQLALLGAGDTWLEAGYRAAATQHAGSVGVRIGYDEDLAHRIIAGADVIVVPSRFEPCGLTQMYGLAYGTLPLVRNVGGLADTVTDANAANLAARTATGFTFEDASARGVEGAVSRASTLWKSAALWRQIRDSAMLQDHRWLPSARKYLDIYRNLRPGA